MKRRVVSIGVVLAILVAAWTALGQDEARPRRQRLFRTGGRLTEEETQKSIRAVEEQLAKLKAIKAPQFDGSFQDLSEEEQAKLREQLMSFGRDRMLALQAITDAVAGLYGRTPPKEGDRYLIVSTSEIKQIQETATKEKATETSGLLGRLIAPRGGGRGTGRTRPRDPQPDATAPPPDRQR